MINSTAPILLMAATLAVTILGSGAMLARTARRRAAERRDSR